MVSMEYERFWNELSKTEEFNRNDERMNRQLRMKAIQENLDGVQRILDVGAGTGAFSIPLAQMGLDVTHLDISDDMLELAKEKAKGLANIRFLKQDAADLGIFADDEFDLVLCFDGAISFSRKKAPEVIAEICRVGKKVMVSVSNKCCMTATWLNYSFLAFDDFHPSIMDMMKTGYFSKENYDDADDMTSITELKAYDVNELTEVLESNHMIVKECRSIGSLTHLYLMHLYRRYPSEVVKEKIDKIIAEKEFIEICDYFDKNIMPGGMGSFERAGLFAVAEKQR